MFKFSEQSATGAFYDDIAIDDIEVSAVSNPLAGTWKLSPVGGALAVGPNQGDGSWWSNPLSEVTTRACIFDDSIKLEANGNMTHYMDGNTWVEAWQDGSGDGCRTPVTPHDGGSDTWSFSNNQLIVNGVGAHFGLPKAYNGGELDASATVPASRTYEVSFSTDSSQMYLDILSAIKKMNIPKFSFDGNYLKEKGMKEGALIGKTLEIIELEWLDNNFSISNERVLKIIEAQNN